MIKNFSDWAIKNLSNIFGLIGILLTFYFGIYYVPSWLSEMQDEKTQNAEKNLQQSIKELIYSDSTCTYLEVATLIQAKAIELNRPYPLGHKELFTQVQESFMQDRFLPLEKRRELMLELQALKLAIPKNTPKQEAKSEGTPWTSLLSLLSIALSIIGVGAGIRSFYLNYRSSKEKDEEINNQYNEVNSLSSALDSALEYEREIWNVLENYPGITLGPNYNRGSGVDIEFDYKGDAYFVEIKYLTQSKVGLSSFQKLLNYQKGLEGTFLFVYNTELTEMVKRRAEESNKLANPYRHTILVRAENGLQFKTQLAAILSE